MRNFIPNGIYPKRIFNFNDIKFMGIFVMCTVCMYCLVYICAKVRQRILFIWRLFNVCTRTRMCVTCTMNGSCWWSLTLHKSNVAKCNGRFMVSQKHNKWNIRIQCPFTKCTSCHYILLPTYKCMRTKLNVYLMWSYGSPLVHNLFF